MQWHLTFNSLILATVAGVALLIALFMSRRPPAPGRQVVCWLFVAIALWAGSDALESAAVSIPAKIWCAKAAYLGIASVPPLWFLFTLEYGQQAERMSRRRRLLLWIVPLLTLGFAATNELHGLIWSEIRPVAATPGAELIYSHGPWFWLAVVYNYSLLVIGSVLLLRAIRRFPQHYRGQTAILILATMLPWIGNLVYLSGWKPSVGLDPTPVAFLLSGLAFAVGLARYRILDLVPVARDVLIEAMRDAVLVVDARRRVVDLNPAARHLLRLQPHAGIGQPAPLLVREWPALAERLDTMLEVTGEVQSCEQPPRILDVQSVPLHDRAGQTGGALLLLRDITTEKQAELAVRRVQAFNERILQQMNEGIVVEDNDGRLVFVNPAAATMLGYVPEELVGRHWSSVVVPSSHSTVEAANRRRAQGHSDRYEIDLVRRDGVPIVVQVTGSAQIDAATGEQVGTLAVVVDLTEQKRSERALQEANSQLQAQLVATEALQAELREQAIRDPLTGLFNRRYLQEILDREVARAVRSTQPLSIVVLDVDHFKQVNDAYGHDAGDQMLQAVGEVLKRHTRAEDIACRIGGDEFVVMLGGTTPEVAAARAEAWSEAFRDLQVRQDGRPFYATLSAGIAGFPMHGTNGSSLLQSADQALYQAKAAGRSRISVLDQPS